MSILLIIGWVLLIVVAFAALTAVIIYFLFKWCVFVARWKINHDRRLAGLTSQKPNNATSMKSPL